MSFPLRGEDRNDNEDDNFIWQDYLDVTNTTEVPHTLFYHVEQSLLNGLQEEMMLEIPQKGNNVYWIASIVMACGPLLRLRHIGLGENRSYDFWWDLTKVKVHPLGWCKSNGLQLAPPIEIQDKLNDYETLIEKAFEEGKSVPPELLSGDGLAPVDRIKQGMKVEVQDKKDPYRLWFATIIENVGGRLLLRYDSPDSSSPDFWLFYSSTRLFRMGWASGQGHPWVLKRPSDMKSHHGIEEWEAVMEMAKEDARRLPLPPDLFQNTIPSTVHSFEVDMKLEAIHPHNMAEICPASVVKVYNEYYFLVKIDSYNSTDSDDIESSWLCTVEHPYILPIGWAQSHGVQLTHPRGWTTSKDEFDWQEYLKSTNSRAAPDSCFPQRTSAKEAGFEPTMKLEAVNPENQHQICAASIVKIIDNLLWIHLDSHDGFHPNHIVSMDSVDIFPVGWCESNSYTLKPPRFYHTQVKTQVKEENTKKESSNSQSTSQQRSLWCPKIFFNHKCFSGPFLSKGKLAQLPKAVGPGPVTLVMREVLTMLISVAYKSSRVLKELQSDGKPKPGMHLEVLKAKYKNNTYRASVAVVTSADQVREFCQAVCARLQVCPFMFGPVSVGENSCPENCNTLSKTRFTQYWVQGKRKIGRPKGEASNMIPRPKKKRGRKRIILNAKATAENVDSKEVNTHTDVSNSKEEDVENDASQDLNNLSEASGNAELCGNARRKYRKKEFPKTAMKTRGAKLPNFALKIRAGHWPHKRMTSSDNEISQKVETFEDIQNTESLETGKTSADKEVMPETKDEPMDTSYFDEKIVKTSSEYMELDSNPLYWSEDDVYQYLLKTDDCAWIAQKCKDELIDGQAFMMLNFPTLKQHLLLKTAPALKLCHHVERIKLAYYLHYVIDSEP